MSYYLADNRLSGSYVSIPLRRLTPDLPTCGSDSPRVLYLRMGFFLNAYTNVYVSCFFTYTTIRYAYACRYDSGIQLLIEKAGLI